MLVMPDRAAGPPAGRVELVRRFRGFLQLLASGVVAAAGLAAIAANRWQLLESGAAVFLLLFVQWQAFCLTVAKCGLEHLIFATVSQDPALHYDLRAAVRRRIGPLSAAVALIALLAFPPWAAAALGVAVVLDSYSLMISAEMNARSRFGTAAFANLLNYPLFFVLIYLLSRVGSAGPAQVTAAFVLTSAVRALWLGLQRRRPPGARSVFPATQLSIATQQVGNFALFRGDQLLLGLGLVQGWLGAGPPYLAAYLFLAKLPELAAGVLNVGGTVTFPLLFGAGREARPALRGRLGAVVAVAALAGLAVAGAAYVQLWKGSARLTLLDALPFLVNAALIFPVNAVTYSMLSRGYLSGLLRFILVGLLAGAGLALVAIATRGGPLLAWVVPLQLTGFLGAAALLGWGRRSALYREDGVQPSASP
jgi:hypothetical protein